MKRLTKLFTALFLLSGVWHVRAEVANPPAEFLDAPTHAADEVLALHSSAYTAVTAVKSVLNTAGAKVGEVKEVAGKQLVYIENALNGWASINFTSAVDISQYGSLNLDIYVVKGAFDCKLQFASGTSAVIISPKLAEGWNRVQLNLSDFVNSLTPPALSKIDHIDLINNGGYQRTVYVDNIYAFGKEGTSLDPEMPETMAPVPTHDAAKVKSIFSDAYTGITEITGLTGTGTLKMLSVSPTERIMKIEGGLNHWANLTFKPVNIDDRDYLHFDIFVVRETGTSTLKFRFDDGKGVTISKVLNPGWNYLDIPMSEFKTDGSTLNAVTQFRMINNAGSAQNVFIDNLYAYGDSETGDNPEYPTAPKESAELPEHAADKVVSLFSNVYDNVATISQQNPGSPTCDMKVITPIKGDDMILLSGMNWTLLKVDPAVNLEGMKFIHFDVFALGTPKINIGLGDGSQEGSCEIQYLEAGWNKIDIPITEFQKERNGKQGVDITKVNMIRLWSSSGFAISELYFDNIYAYDGYPGGEYYTYEIESAPEPIMPHTTSSRLTMKYVVKSLYSDKYTAMTELTAGAAGEGTTVSFPLLEKGEAVIKIESLSQAVLDTRAALDLSDMEYIHVNVYRKGASGDIEIGFRSEGATEGFYSALRPELKNDGWSYVNIPLSDLTVGGVDCSKITQILFRGTGDFYIDNIYATSGKYFLGLGEEDKISVDWAEASKADVLPDRNQALIGVNLASACGGATPGIVGQNYTYPTKNDIRYFKSKGARLIRFPFKWERVQHELNGALDMSLDVDSMKNVIGEASRLGMYVMIDMHNYCRYKVSGTEHKFGESAVLTEEAYADVWRKLADVFKEYDNIWGYDIMNEPYSLGEGVWMRYAQAAINAIREVDATTPIVIEGQSYASASSWPTTGGPLIALQDPSNRLVFQAHCYFDADKSGLYKKGTFDSEVSKETQHIDRLKPYVNWLKEHNVEGILGEFGVPRNDARWLMMLEEVLEYLKENGVSGTYWVAGNGYASDHVSVQPLKDFTVERAQMRVLEKYFYDYKESAIEEVKAAGEKLMTVYPNPVTDCVRIDTESAMKRVRVLAASGSEVRSLAVDGTHAEIGLTSLADGIYFVQVQMADGTIVVDKIVKR